MRERLLKLLKEILSGIDFDLSDTMVDDGILDSLALTCVISEISMEFGINIPFEELTSDNFNSVDKMAELIGRCPKNNIL